MSAHYVYRVFDGNGRLIYVGCTNDLFRRLKAHKSTWWADQADRVYAQVHPTRRIALAMERLAIAEERPRWNLKGSFTHSRTWTPSQFEDYITATLRQPVITRFMQAHLNNVRRLYRARFGEDAA